MNNIEYFWNYFTSKNIKRIFGLPGGGIFNLLSEKPDLIKWTNVGHELQNGFIASVYGYYTKNVGLLFVTTGPGIATPLSAYKNAEAENQPLMVISTFNPLVNEDFQWWNIKQIGNTIGNTIYIKNDKQFHRKLHKAYDLATTQNTSVMLLININILQKITQIPKEIQLKKEINYINSDIDTETKSIINKIKCKFSGKKILIVIGKGNCFDYTIVKDFILRNELPYITTWKQRFVIKNSLYCGRFGSLGNHSANYAVIKANRILIIGDISGELTTPYYANKFSFLKLNQNSVVYSLTDNINSTKNIKNINKTFITNNIDYILNRININSDNKWNNTITVGNNNLLFVLPRVSQLEKYIYSAAHVYKQNNLEIPVTSGVGNHWYALGKYIDMTEPNLFESTTNWSSIGTGLANGIGIYYATNKPVWIFEGDGGFIFSASTFLYLLENPDLPLTVTLTVDKTYSAVSQLCVSKQIKCNESNYVPYNSWKSLLPNSIIFSNETDYYDYLTKNPISNYVRYIILVIDNTDLNGSLVYEIDINNDYINNAKKNNFKELINAPMIL